METLKRMALVVDGQKVEEASYLVMCVDFEKSLAFQAA